MTKTTMTVAIADITFERALQFRTYTDATHVADLASVWETDGKFQERPVLSRVVDEEGNVKYYVKDGTHRILGAKEAGAEEIEVDVVDVEDFEGALFEAIDVNTRHGKAATVDDLKLIIRAVKDSSRVDEFKKSRFAWDKNKLRALLKCSPRKFERAIVDTNAEFDLERDYEIQKLYETGMSQVSIAKEVECSRRTVQNVIAAYEENKAATFSQMAEKSTPWDDDVIELTDDYDFEYDVAEDVDNLISSLCRQEELNVVKHTATPKVDIDQWAAMFFSMSSEEQTKALAAINVIK
ncbi:ParB N-terminal domain-containing protein [Vibrio alginolyticus]|uniref:ParB N-terminal domain-containing protein n=1 Tax=Vibrio alginolyticus TaxID=663 RepID=UPI00215B85A9|nr:helix-turn-helix domain-containing protein [Vibrio alginolyticus]MCR9513271.1 helix-turn-helix domain-containing protein [Vibrio alginolyticus]